jgi:DnaJ-class molecular chaperone
MSDFPPPHRILYECLNDRETKTLWDAYKTKYADQCEFEEVDAAVSNSMDDFARSRVADLARSFFKFGLPTDAPSLSGTAILSVSRLVSH